LSEKEKFRKGTGHRVKRARFICQKKKEDEESTSWEKKGKGEGPG